MRPAPTRPMRIGSALTRRMMPVSAQSHPAVVAPRVPAVGPTAAARYHGARMSSARVLPSVGVLALAVVGLMGGAIGRGADAGVSGALPQATAIVRSAD